jgi:flagellar basal-body rod protein FlgF
MTDKAIFIGMSGAKTSMHELEIVTNNLANANTTGFRADYEVAKQNPINNDPKQTRIFSTINRTYTDFESGPTITTGRDLDVALSSKGGFIAVQGKGGQEGYTRAGDLQIVNGTLVTRSGDLVLGNGGVIDIPPAEKLNIAADGSISIRITGNPQMIPVDRIKLVSPELGKLSKGADGLFYLQGNETARLDEKLTKLIELSRHFEVHTNMMKTMQENASKANQILELQG